MIKYFFIIIIIIFSFLLKYLESFFVNFKYNKMRSSILKEDKFRKILAKWFNKRDLLMASLHFLRYLLEIFLVFYVFKVFEINYLFLSLYVFIILLAFCEYLPRALSMQSKLKYVYFILKPFYYFLYIIIPFVRLILIPVNVFLKIFGFEGVLKRGYFGRLEDKIIKQIFKEGSLQERKMINSVLEFKDIVAKEIMVPRVDIVAVPVDISYEELINIIEEKGHSRLPVYDERLDDILGIIYVKDLIKIDHETFNIKSLLRKAFFLPETKKINQLLKDFQTKHQHMAFVVDEYGDIIGLVTIEDVLEEIVGEIEDEYDVEEILYKELSQKEYVVSSKMSIEEFEESFNIDLELYSDEDDFETIAGFIISKLGVLPQKGQKLDFEKFSFKIIEADERRIKKILLTIKKNKTRKNIEKKEKEDNK